MSTTQARDFDVVIVGAGVIGAAMASLLVARQLSAPGRVAIIADRFATAASADADWDLRVFALSRASERLLKACGVWDSLPAKRVFAYDRMCVWDADGEERELRWIERGIVVRGRPAGPPLPVLVPIQTGQVVVVP